MRRKTIAASLAAAVASAALAQGTVEQPARQQSRQQRLEEIEKQSAAQEEASRKFRESLEKDGVHLECAKSRPGPIVLYRGHVHRVGAKGMLQPWARYLVADGVATWWDEDNIQWSLKLDDWSLQGVRKVDQARQSEQCRKLRGDTNELVPGPADTRAVR